MITDISTSTDLLSNGFRLDAAYHTSEGIKAYRILKNWLLSDTFPNSKRKLDRLGDISTMFIGDWLKRIYVDDPEHGASYLSGDTMLRQNPLESGKFLSFLHGDYIEQLALKEQMIVMTCSGTIGNLLYVNSIMKDSVGSPDLLRILVKPGKILPGYLYTFLSSIIGKALIHQGIYGGVIQHIEIPYLNSLPIPRIDSNMEEQIDQLTEQAAKLRVEADLHLRRTQDRFYQQVLGINSRDISWNYRNEHAFAIGTTHFNNQFHCLDAFHHVGYVGEAEQYLIKKIPLGELIEAFQPPMFKRPYTDENGIPFLSGIDLYNYYPKPHMFISRKMERLESYIVESGTILVQNVGQRYGLFGRPTIMPKHLSKCAITQHLMRVYPKDALNRGFVFIWLSTEIGRRLLLKNSFGTSMGVLFERSFTEMFCPDCSNDLRHSFEKDLETIVQMRDHANELEDQAQSILASGLELEE